MLARDLLHQAQAVPDEPGRRVRLRPVVPLLGDAPAERVVGIAPFTQDRGQPWKMLTVEEEAKRPSQRGERPPNILVPIEIVYPNSINASFLQ